MTDMTFDLSAIKNPVDPSPAVVAEPPPVQPLVTEQAKPKTYTVSVTETAYNFISSMASASGKSRGEVVDAIVARYIAGLMA